MDCRESQQVFSAIFDGEPVEDAERTEAEAHCVDCAECQEFRRALETLAKAPAPVAPNALANRVIDAVGDEAQAAGGAPPVVVPPVAAEEAAVPWLTRRRAYVLAGASAAVLLIVVLAIWGVVAASNSSTKASVDEALRRALSGQGGVIPPGGAPAAQSVAPTTTVAAGVAPNYVTYQDRIYQESASLEDTTALIQIGTLTSALSSNGTAVSQPVLRLSSVATASIVLRLPDKSLDWFTPVARKFGALTYVLQTQHNIDRFGQWPDLPSQFNQPTGTDGAPTFRQIGTDSSGVAVFAPPGAAASNGIAVGPNTPSTDPAAGNPNWTWWTPL